MADKGKPSPLPEKPSSDKVKPSSDQIKVPWYMVLIDFLCLNLVGWSIFFIPWFSKPLTTGFFCHDMSELSHPFLSERLPFDWLYLIGIGLNFVFILILEIVLRNTETREVKFLGCSPPPWLYFFIYRLVLFVFGAGCTQLATTFLKYRVGKFTPHFYTVCNPKTIPNLPCVRLQRHYFSPDRYYCSNFNYTQEVVRNMRLSFPSLHASYSMYAMLYLAFYLQVKFNWEGSRLLKPSLQYLAFCGSLLISLTRNIDYRHDFSDIIAGLLLGAIMACVTVGIFGREFETDSDKDLDEKEKEKEKENVPVTKIILDFLLLNLVCWPILFLYLWGTPFTRGYFCDDLTIRYPYYNQDIPSYVLYIVGFAVICLVMIIIEIITTPNKEIVLFKFQIPKCIYNIYSVVGTFGFGAACSQLTNDFIGHTIGRLTPHFHSVCRPRDNCDSTLYTKDYKCRWRYYLTPRMYKNMRLSFPSGDATFSMYATIYFAIYLQKRLTWKGSKLLRPTLQFATVLAAVYIATNQVANYQNHWSDVVCGAIIGAIVAVITTRYFTSFWES